MDRRALLLTPLLLMATTVTGGAEPPAPKPAATSTIEMVFVLDTTGSMGGLIDGAKARIWGIVNEVMKAPSHPQMRIGLVAYRDRGDAYVVKTLPLTSDLDKVYATLMDYRAEGGGDGPEDVESALYEGVHNAGWASRRQRLAQVLFLVGDAPPHEDYQDKPDVGDTAAEAIRRGITVNTIQCGGMPGTREIWQKVARLAEGEYFAIAQDGGVQVVATPFDKKLGELGNRVGQTYVAYADRPMAGGMGGAMIAGRARVQRETETRFAAAAPSTALAERAVNKAVNTLAYNEGDLLQAYENKSVKLETLKSEQLPDDLKKLSPEARKKEIERRLAERKKLRGEILDLSKKRDAYLADERKKLAARGGKSSGFDAAVAATLKKQALRRGIKL